jgi:hypothetical protein
MNLTKQITLNTLGGVREEYWTDDAGHRHGDYVAYDINGDVTDCTSYVNGLREGEYKWWVNNRLVFYAVYRDDKLHGECRCWYDSGVFEGCAFFKDGTNITKEVLPYADNPVMIVLKFGIPMLSDRSLCKNEGKYLYD